MTRENAIVASGVESSRPSVDDGLPSLFVFFKIDGTDYGLPAETVLQMESFSGATPVPGTQPFVAGIMQLRGKVIPVIDLRVRFGLPRVERTIDTRVVVGMHEERVVALIVDSAREVARVSPSQRRPPPRLAGGDASSFVREIAQLGERAILVLDFAKVIGEERIDV